MPLGVYSTRLALRNIDPASGLVALFTVPVGYRIVIRDIQINQVGGTGSETLLYHASSGLVLFRVNMPANVNGSTHAVRIVCHEGETIQGRALSRIAGLCISGYQLFGAGAPLTPAQLPAIEGISVS
jgi:hypothetical protein